MTDTSRTDMLRALAARVGALRPGHPVRVAVDGRTASGKTTLTDELAATLAGHGRSGTRS